MKQNFNLLLASLAFVGACTFTACSDDDDDFGGTAPAEKVFPELPDSVPNVAVGDTGKIAFDAYDQWTVSADQTWVKFKKTGSADIPSVSVSGPKGQHAVTYVIGDENLDFESKTAHVVFSMDNKKDTMVISRVAKERTFEFFAVTETEEGFVYTKADKLEMEYNDVSESFHAKYAVRSNYKWTLNVPEWVDIISSSVSAEPNDTVSNVEDLKIYFIDVNNEKATVEDMAGMLDFKDYDAAEDAPAINSVAVSCKGTASWNRILTTFPEEINFTPEGMFENADMGMEMDCFRFKTMAAKGNEYKFFLLPKNGEWYGVQSGVDFVLDASELGWFSVEESEFMAAEEYPTFTIRNYEIKATAAQEDRVATMLAIPASVAEKIQDVNTDLLNSDGDAILPDYQQYIVGELTQAKGAASADLVFSMAEWLPDGVEGITIEPMSADELAIYSGDFGVSKGYVVTYNSFENYTMSQMKLGDIEGQCAVSYTDPDTALYDGESQGWLIVNADMGFQGFQFDFTNKFAKFEGSRQATVVLIDPDTYQSHVVIRVVQNADNGSNE